MRTKTTIIATLCSAAAVLYCIIGCEQPSLKGLLTLNLTDAPANYEHVYITFTEVSIHKAVADNETVQVGTDNQTDNATDNGTAFDNETDTGSGWIVINTEEQGFDLLELQDGNFDLLAQAELATGKYTQIRLKITDAVDESGNPKTYVAVDNETYPLTVPSGTKSGLKLTKPFTIEPEGETVLYLDFDASKSVKQTGSGKYKLQPTIKVLTELP